MASQKLRDAAVQQRDAFHRSVLYALNKFHEGSWVRMALKYRAWFIGLFQALLIFSSLVAAWLLRFNFFLPYRLLLLSAAPILILIRLCAIARFGLLRGWWRYTDIDDAVAIVKAIAIGSLVFVFCMREVLGIVAFPRAIYILEPLLSTLLLAGARVFSRVIAESFRLETAASRKVILIGAGTTAEMTLRAIASPGSGYSAVGCVDDDTSKTGGKIHGVPVLGSVDALPALVAKHEIEEILVAVPSATAIQMQKFVEVCGKANVRFQTVPSLHEILNGQIHAAQFRYVRLDDLLGRDPVEIDLESVRTQIVDQTVVVTGAAGTIGSELCRQVLQAGPGKLLCLDRNETEMFYLQMELSKQKKETQLVFCVTDFGDDSRVRNLLAEHRPDVIFHAAAYKHVPMMETNVHDAVKNNIFALRRLLDLAEESGCPAFVLISSDKAVNPTNMMGATKRVGELIVSCRPTRSMRCVSVRFGNVLGSNGSVVPIFQRQIRDGQPLTITHPEVTRFFMTTHEAVSLVLEAFAIGNHGDTLVLDMGRPVCILELARALIRLSGKSEREVGIQFIGLRDGEKLFEELSYPDEEIQSTSSPKIRRIRGTPHLWFDLEHHLDQLWRSIHTKDSGIIREMMKGIVPEYTNPTNGRLEGIAVRVKQELVARPNIFEPTVALR